MRETNALRTIGYVLDPHTVYTPPRIVRETGLPRAAVYEALRSGSLPAVRRGRTWYVGGSALIEFIAALGRGGAAR